MTTTVRQLINPTKPEIESTVKVLSEAFQYAVFLTELGGDKSLVPVLLKTHVTAALIEGEVYVAEMEEKGIVGVAVWFGPGQKFLDTGAQRSAGWDQLMRRLDKKYSSWWDYYVEAYNAFCERSLGAGFKRNAYHLQLYGVLPECQRGGIGRALMDEVGKKAMLERIPLCVETDASNVAKYESMGFVVCGEEMLQGISGRNMPIYCLSKQV
ncbi:hypothetical protein K439DRAFT_1661199 [Ramaria rubella]|nr:hypothetical protein K439DRAFT_1661199 [Ramaria rubella]